MPSLVHSMAQTCAAEIPAAAGEVAIRFAVAGGTLSAVEGDPKGPSATCFESTFRSKDSTFAKIPDGVGLVRLEISAATTP